MDFLRFGTLSVSHSMVHVQGVAMKFPEWLYCKHIYVLMAY